MAKDFQNLKRTANLHVQGDLRTPEIKTQRPPPIHKVIKLSKDKESRDSQDGRLGRQRDHILSWLHQNYDYL